MQNTISVRNPRSGQQDYQIYPPNSQELSKLCKNLRSHQTNWQESGIAHRVAVLKAWKIALQKYLPELIEALSEDTGRKSESILEADILLSSIDRWIHLATDFFAVPKRKKSATPFIEIEQDVVPYQLVGVISPWNFPLLLSIIDSLPALLAGCAVVVKPSEITPRFIAPLMRSIAEVPELSNIFAYITGAGQTGADLINHTDLICFTGSVATGKSVYKAAAERFIPVFLELGGKDAALVFEGADLDSATSSLLWGSVVNAGQSCLSIERIYVQASIFDQFVEKLVAKADKLRFNYPNIEEGEISPIISQKQTLIIKEHLQDAKEKGAKFLTGGMIEHWGGGEWCFPTIVVDVSPDMKLMTDESFAPILPIMPFEDEKQAIELANSTVFGLSGAVFAATELEAIRIGRKMHAGAISINECALTALVHEGEKNAFKMSGIGGTRMGIGAMRRFMRQKAFLIKTEAVPSPWWFQ